MPMHDLGSRSSGTSDGDVVSLDLRGREAARQAVANEIADTASLLAQSVREQLERDIADIERASAALRRAEPALESWSDPPQATAGKPRPLWLIIGLLWFSTVLVTAGAVVAIASLAG